MPEIIVRKCRVPNLGDSMNDNLLEFIAQRKLPTINHQVKTDKTVLIAIGSILQWATPTTLVWGSGFITAKSSIHAQPKKICAVRGPLSRERILTLGFTCPEIYGDPALLYPLYYKPKIAKKYKLGIVAHYIDRHSLLFKRLLKDKSILDINVKGNVNKTVNQICSCERIVSSSLHGLIVADAYGIPSAWIKITDKVIGAGFKFRDYFASVGRTDIVPLIVNNKTTTKDMLNKFSSYEIKIDLKKLLDCCPVKK